MPQINCIVDGAYKVRAIVDSGSTTTILSSALVVLMPEVKRKMAPTSLTFSSANNGKDKYEGLIGGVTLQISPSIVVKVNAAVVKNDDVFILLGQNVLGGNKSQLQTLLWNTQFSVIVVAQESTGLVETIHYIKNTETTSLPDPAIVTHHVKAEESEDAVGPLLLR